MHQIIFYPVGNGDTSQIILNRDSENPKRLLFDFRYSEQNSFDLTSALRQSLGETNYFDVVAFTHGDKDHIAGSTNFFELKHASKYQGSGRIKINELWVPAAMILEPSSQEQRSDEFVIWRQEARYRLKKGEGIRVFSKPACLKTWLLQEGIQLKSRSHLITDAGQIVPGIQLNQDGCEFFCHSPFIKHLDSGDIIRNESALIFQVRFCVDGTEINYLAIGDSDSAVLDDVVSTTEFHGHHDRLKWDLFNIPHHCSSKALNLEDKGDRETTPTENVKKLLGYAQPEAYIISSSNPIPDTKEGYMQIQPPHIQAKKCYENYLRQKEGRKFLVTMEYPNSSEPQPIVFEISQLGCRLLESKQKVNPVFSILSRPAPRAG